jgi:uncharacterized protein (TIGR03083 family)
MTTSPRDLIATMRSLHDRLAQVVVELGPDQLRAGSYDSEWTVADVLSHLGSGSELALMRLRAGSADSPTDAENAEVWAKWDARTPEQQAVESMAVEQDYVAALEACDDQAVDALKRQLAGLDLSAAQVLLMRVSEQAMHGWDVAVAFDDSAVVADVAVPAVFDLLWLTLRWATQPYDGELRVRVRTTDPAGDYLLEIVSGETRLNALDGDSVTGLPAVDSELQLPAEALLRLFYGRLDPRHTPPHKVSDDGLLDRLRDLFRGF